jgi:hypothetical protein
MIKLACPNCTKQLAVEDSTAGSVCKCPACASKFRVPEAAKEQRAAVTKSRPPGAKRSGGRDSDIDRVEPAPEKSSGTTRPGRSPRDSSAVRPGNGSNGIVLDRLEVVDDEDDQPRRKTGRKTGRREPTPTWVYVTASAAGVLLCAMLAAAIYFKYVAIAMIVIGLPASLLSRKWHLLGAVGVAYLLSGAGLFLLHNSLLRTVDGPPPAGASAQVIDSHCATLLTDPYKKDASSWVGVEKPTDSSQIRGLRALVKDAYDAGAPKVWVTNLDRKDEVKNPIPNLIVVLPDDDDTRQRVLAWYRTVSRKRLPGDRYLYVDWD